MICTRLVAWVGVLALCASNYAIADESVEGFLERYEAALDHGNVAEIARLYENPDPTRDRKLRVYFENVVAEYNAEIENLQIIARESSDSLRIRFDRRDRFTDRETGKRIEKSASHERLLRKRDGFWKFAKQR